MYPTARLMPSMRIAKTDSRINHLFLTKEFDVKKYGVLTDTYRSEAKDAQEISKMRIFRRRSPCKNM